MKKNNNLKFLILVIFIILFFFNCNNYDISTRSIYPEFGAHMVSPNTVIMIKNLEEWSNEKKSDYTNCTHLYIKEIDKDDLFKKDGIHYPIFTESDKVYGSWLFDGESEDDYKIKKDYATFKYDPSSRPNNIFTFGKYICLKIPISTVHYSDVYNNYYHYGIITYKEARTDCIQWEQGIPFLYWYFDVDVYKPSIEWVSPEGKTLDNLTQYDKIAFKFNGYMVKNRKIGNLDEPNLNYLQIYNNSNPIDIKKCVAGMLLDSEKNIQNITSLDWIDNYKEEENTSAFEIPLSLFNVNEGTMIFDVPVIDNNINNNTTNKNVFSMAVDGINGTIRSNNEIRDRYGKPLLNNKYSLSINLNYTPSIEKFSPIQGSKKFIKDQVSIKIYFNCPMNTFLARNQFYVRKDNNNFTDADLVSGVWDITGRVLTYTPPVGKFATGDHIYVQVNKKPDATTNYDPVDIKGNRLKDNDPKSKFDFYVAKEPAIVSIQYRKTKDGYFSDYQEVYDINNSPPLILTSDNLDELEVKIKFNCQMDTSFKSLILSEDIYNTDENNEITESNANTGVFSEGDTVLTFKDFTYFLYMCHGSTITLKVPSDVSKIKKFGTNDTLEESTEIKFKLEQVTLNTNFVDDGKTSFDSSCINYYYDNVKERYKCNLKVEKYNFLADDNSNQRYTQNVGLLSIHSAFKPANAGIDSGDGTWRFYNIEEKTKAKNDRLDYTNNEYALKFKFNWGNVLGYRKYNCIIYNQKTRQVVKSVFDLSSKTGSVSQNIMLTNHNFPIINTGGGDNIKIIITTDEIATADLSNINQLETNLINSHSCITFDFNINYYIGVKSYSDIDFNYEIVNVLWPFEITGFNDLNTNFIGREFHGYRQPNHYLGARSQTHYGCDYYGFDFNKIGGVDDNGSELHSPFDGIIIQNDFLSDYGNSVVIQSSDNNNIAVRFAHLQDAPPVYNGKRVTAGELIGYLGDSGTTNSHLHIAFYKNINTEYDRDGDGTANQSKSLYSIINYYNDNNCDKVILPYSPNINDNINDRMKLKKIRDLYALKVKFDSWQLPNENNTNFYTFVPANLNYPYKNGYYFYEY